MSLLPASPSQSVSAWAATHLGFTPDPFQCEVLDCDDPNVILCCSRQIGKTQVTAAKALHTALTVPGARILIVSHVGPQAGETLARIQEFAAHLGLRTRGDGNNERSLVLPNGSRFIALPDVPASLRGYSQIRMLIIDEAAFVDDRAYSAVSPVLAISRGARWILSTPHGQQGFFHDLWHDDASGFTRFTLKASDCPRFDAAFLARERRLHGEAAFLQEYMCQFVSSGAQFLTRDLLQRASIAGPVAPPAALTERTELYLGLDLGKRADHTGIVLLELTWRYGLRNPVNMQVPMYPTLTLRFAERLPLDTPTLDLPRYVADLLVRFHPPYYAPKIRRTVMVDATGNGHTLVELMRRANLQVEHFKPVTITGGHKSNLLKDGYTAVPREDLLSRLRMLFESGTLKLDRQTAGFEVLTAELEAFEYSGRQHEHDDLVFALALAAYDAGRNHKELFQPHPTADP